MICLEVEPLTISDFKEVIATHQFDDIQDFHNFIDQFFIKYKKDIRAQVKLEENQLEELNRRKYNKQIENEYYEMMDGIDEKIFERKEYIEKIESRKKYKGRYYYGNPKGKTFNGKRKKPEQLKTPVQLRIVYSNRG